MLMCVDLRGSYFTNSELDLGLSLQFNPKISAHVYTTVNSVYSLSGQGQIPAGAGLHRSAGLRFILTGLISHGRVKSVPSKWVILFISTENSTTISTNA